MKVKLNYFRETGKWYSEGEYDTERILLFEIFEEVKQLRDTKKLPGLMEGHSFYFVLIDVPEHEHNYPHLVI